MSAAEQQFCTFFLDSLFLGVEVQRVQEVLRQQEMTQVPLAPPVVRGLINLRGQIVTAIDLRRRLELPQRAGEDAGMNVVVRTDDGAVSLLVDEIGDVLNVPMTTFEPPPETVTGVARQLVRGIHKLDQRLLLVLDIDRTVDLTAPRR
ncbi:MAG TPA: chemotaxis protein CheW [Polyangia bacterium]|nr:chemotaxis protein CheW [Polyangia bacterium]